MILLATGFGQELNLLLGISGTILILSLILKYFKQPYIIAYIATGVLLGPFGFRFITDYSLVEVLGELGLILLMFFIGMEISLKDFVKNWRVSLFGTGSQILISILLMAVIGFFYSWPMKRVILLGFIISLSSSAVVIRLLEDFKIIHKKIGKNVMIILLTQDVLIVPMILIMTFLSGSKVETDDIILQIVGGVIITGILLYILRKESIKIPFADKIEGDHELQVFTSLILCFGFALFTSVFGLSPGLGAFVAGLLMHSSPSTHWLHENLLPFRIILVSVFFLSVGMLIDLNFLVANWRVILLLVISSMATNQVINGLVLRFLGNSRQESSFGSSILAQVGEFSFVLASLGFHAEILTEYTYQLTIITIAITISISAFWGLLFKKINERRGMTLLD